MFLAVFQKIVIFLQFYALTKIIIFLKITYIQQLDKIFWKTQVKIQVLSFKMLFLFFVWDDFLPSFDVDYKKFRFSLKVV